MENFTAVPNEWSDHVADGRLTLPMFNILWYLLRTCTWGTGVWTGEAERIRYGLNRAFSVSQINRHLTRLHNCGYISRLNTPGRRGGYKILINNYAHDNSVFRPTELKDWRDIKDVDASDMLGRCVGDAPDDAWEMRSNPDLPDFNPDVPNDQTVSKQESKQANASASPICSLDQVQSGMEQGTESREDAGKERADQPPVRSSSEEDLPPAPLTEDRIKSEIRQAVDRLRGTDEWREYGRTLMQAFGVDDIDAEADILLNIWNWTQNQNPDAWPPDFGILWGLIEYALDNKFWKTRIVGIASLSKCLCNETEKGLSAQYRRYLSAQARKKTAKQDAAGVPEYQRGPNHFTDKVVELCYTCGKFHSKAEGCKIDFNKVLEAEAGAM